MVWRAIVMPNVVWDVVEMYNYAKTTPLTANHGTLVNYTDNELGIPDVSQQTAFQDFYEKNSNPENWYESPVQPNEEDNIEVHSQLPPPVKAFVLNNHTMTVDNWPASTEGYTFLFTLKFPNTTISDNEEWLRINSFGPPNLAIRNQSSGIQAWKADYNTGTLNSIAVTGTSFEGLDVYDYIHQYALVVRVGGTYDNNDQKWFYDGRSQPQGVIPNPTNAFPDLGGFSAVFFARNTTPQFQLNATVLGFSCYTRELKPKELLRLHNNSLLRNPAIEGTPAIHFLLNDDAFSEDGTNVILKNYGSTGTTNDAKVFGLTGATSADQLADVSNHLININDLY